MTTSAIPLLAATAGFTSTHIAVTALITGAIAGAAAAWRITGRHRAINVIAVAVITTAAVYLWRSSANMAQLNDDGLPGFSANDWLAPAITFIALSLYKDLHPPADIRRFNQVRAITTIAAFAVNVITI